MAGRGSRCSIRRGHCLGHGLALLNKAVVARERPGQLLDDIRTYEDTSGSLGYPSGHMAVATALGLVIAHYVPQRHRRYVWAAIGAVGVARVYVGAHFPIDVIGGLLVGWLAVGLTRLIVGYPGAGARRRPRRARQPRLRARAAVSGAE